jgi:hypothetical protein
MLQKGAPIDWLQKQMGHRNLTMLIRHYWRWINPGELSQPSLLTTKSNSAYGIQARFPLLRVQCLPRPDRVGIVLPPHAWSVPIDLTEYRGFDDLDPSADKGEE